MLSNTKFFEDVYQSIKDGIPSKNRKIVKEELTAIAQKHNNLSGNEFRHAFLEDAKPLISIYSRIDLKQELATIRYVLYIFLVLLLTSLIVSFAIDRVNG